MNSDILSATRRLMPKAGPEYTIGNLGTSAIADSRFEFSSDMVTLTLSCMCVCVLRAANSLITKLYKSEHFFFTLLLFLPLLPWPSTMPDALVCTFATAFDKSGTLRCRS